MEIDARVAIEEGVFADEHGIGQSGLRAPARGVHLGAMLDVDAGSPEFEAGSGEAGERDARLKIWPSQGGDAAAGQVALESKANRECEVGGSLSLTRRREVFAERKKAGGREAGLLRRG